MSEIIQTERGIRYEERKQSFEECPSQHAAFPLAIILMTDLLGALVASATLLPIEVPSSESPKKHSFTFGTEFKEGTSLCLKNRQRFLLTVCV